MNMDKFYLLKKRSLAGKLTLLAAFLFFTSGVQSQVILSQDFESAWTTASTLSPAWSSVGTGNNQWQKQSYFTGWTSNSGLYAPTGIGSCGSLGSARFHSYDATSGTTGDLITPTMNFSAVGTKTLTFWMINTSNNSPEKLEVALSVDNGLNYGAVLSTSTLFANWTLVTVNLGTSTATQCKVRFRATSDFGTSDIGIDRVTVFNGSNAMSGTYTIDNSIAASATNYTCFTSAIADLNERGISASVIFNVKAGQTFTEDAPYITATGTSTNTITFQRSGAGANPVIKPTGTAAIDEAGFTIKGGDYFTFDGIDVTIATGSAVEYGYYLTSATTTNGAQNNTIKNTKIILNRTNTSSLGIFQFTTTAASAAGANSNNKYYNFTIENAYNGIYLLGTAAFPDLNSEIGTTAGGTTIVGAATANDIGNSTIKTSGIQVAQQQDVKIFNCEVRNVTGTGNPNVYGIWLETSKGTSLIYNNKVHDISSSSNGTSTAVYGIRTDVGAGLTANVYNNFVYNIFHTPTSASATQTVRGIAGLNNASGTTNFYYNSVRIATTSANTSSTAFYNQQGIAVLKNNIFTNFSAGGATSKRYAAYISSGTLSASDYNDLYVAAGTNNFTGFNTTDQATLANWQTSTAKDAASIAADPQFISATNLHINAATNVVDGKGNAITGYANDIDGDVRCTSACSGTSIPDIGADEFTSTVVCAVTPSGVAASSITPTSASISFTCTSCTGTFVLEYGAAGFTPGTGAAAGGGTVITSASSPVALSGLTANVSYDVYIRNNCSGSDYSSNSVKLSFTTPCANNALTYTQGFNAVTIPTCWSQQFVSGTTPLQFVASSSNPPTTPQEGADYVYWNSFVSATSGNQTRLVSAPITTTGSPSVNAKFYWFHDNSAYTTVGYADEGIKLQYSLNGSTWFDVQTINRLLTGTNGWTLYDISLPAGAGNAATMYVGFLFTSRGGDNCALDNLTVYVPAACSTPTDQPAALSLTAVTSTTLSGSFTAASPAPTGYIVTRSTSSVPPALTNGATYTVGSTYLISGNNYTIVSYGSATSFTESSLTPGTQYYYYVFSYNGSCAGAPYFLNTSPPGANTLTCTAAPATLTGTAASATSATISFSAVSGAASYILQYSVAGANAWIIASPAPTVSPYTLNGLTSGTAYDIRLEGPNSACGTTRTTTSAFTTPCSIASLTYTQGFNASVIPACWSVANIAVQTATKISFVTTGSNPSVTPYEGSNCVQYNSFSSTNGGAGSEERLVCTALNTTGVPSVDVDFFWANENNTSYNSGAYLNEGVQLQYSINGGANWINTGSFIPRHDGTLTAGTAQWKRKTITLPGACGNIASLLIGFKFHSEYGDNCFLDKVTVKATPPCNYAGIASIAAASACGGSGSTTLSATDYSVSGAGLAYQWQYSNDNFVSNIVDLPSGTNPASANTGTVTSKTYYRLRVFCTSAGYSYSNIVSFSVGTYAINTTTPATRCGIGTVTLQATASTGSTISWYTTATGGTAIGTGGSFVTPEISATTNYYVGANDGSAAATIGATYSGSNTNDDFVGSHGIVINTTSPNIVIVSAKIPFTGKGTFTIQLQTTAGAVVSTVVTDEYTGGGSVPVTIPLNIAVTTPGTYRLLITAITGTIFDLGYISSATFPYTGLGGAFSVTSGYWYGNTSTSNMYLFNLVVTNLCESARTLVAATVTPAPALTLSTNAVTICSGSSTTINVTTPGSNFSTYAWLPATGVTPGGSPSGMTVTLNPTSTTNYTLTATSASGCVNKTTALITVNAAPPTTTGAAVCSGTNASISATTACATYGNPTLTVTGSWNATTDPTAPRPIIYIANSPTCNFDPAVIRNYVTQDFQVTVTGTYSFVMPNTTAYDGMGYIVTGPFVPGTCPGSGTWIVGDDDSGPTLFEPLMSATLTAGVTYTLITTTYSASSGTVTDNFTWNVTGPVGGAITTVSGGALQWYTVASGGTSISSASPFNPVGVAGSGIASNTSAGSYTFYAACSNNPTCRTATGYVIGSGGQWIGASNTAWSNVANWCGGVPTISTDATISLGAPNMPLLNAGTGAVRNLAVNTGASLTISNATMQIAGTITATNTINAAAGTIELAGSTAQAISGSSFTGRTINNLIASNSVNVSAAVNDSMKITGILSFGNVNSKVFNSGDNMILVSNAAGTARVADITNNGANSGNSFTGKFVVQRYIPARRAWRLMTAPLTAGAQTINQAWQEGVGGAWASDPRPGYGTHITGGAARNTTQGFDQGPNNASIFGYSGTGWNYLPATTSELVTNREGWMLFVRGSRSINLPLSNTGTVPDNTTLRPTGTIKFGTQPTITSAAGGFTVIGNPFPSPVNFKTINKTGVIGGVGGNAYYLWDPNLGGSYGVGAFVTFSYNSSGTYDKSIVSGTGSSSITNTGVIPSSAAFVVNLNAGGTIAIAEKDKDTVIYTQPYVFRPVAAPSSIRVSLYGTEADGSKGIADGNLVTFSEASNTALDVEDAIKINNFQENFALLREGTKISIERRNLLVAKDTIFYSMWNMKRKNYELEIATTDLNIPFGTNAFLEDSYRHQKTLLGNSDTTRISFAVTDDAASAAGNRFMIVIEPTGVVPVSFTDIRAYELNHDIMVEWKVQNEININRYEVERSLDGMHFISIGNANATGGNVTYNTLDQHAVTGDNFYRIKSIGNDGQIQYSRIVKVTISKGKPSISIYPNPVRDGIVNMSLNNMPAGIYFIKMYNAIGQVVYTKQITHAGGNAAETIRLEKKLARGIYQLKVIADDASEKTYKLIIE